MYKIVKIALVVVSVVGFILLFMMPSSDMPVGEQMGEGSIDAMHWLAYILLAIAVAATLIFGIKNMVSTPGGLKKSLFGVVGLLVVVGIAYGLSSGTDISVDEMMSKNKIETSESEIRRVGAGIYTFGIMLLAAVVLIAWGAIKNATSK